MSLPNGPRHQRNTHDKGPRRLVTRIGVPSLARCVCSRLPAARLLDSLARMRKGSDSWQRRGANVAALARPFAVCNDPRY